MNIDDILGKALEFSEIREKQDELQRRSKELLVPVYTDLKLVEKIYAMVNQVMKARGEKINRGLNRFKFLIIVLSLFSPQTLCGKKIVAGGLRDVLAKLLGVHSSSAITNHCKNIIFYWKNYSDFRKDVYYLWSEIQKGLPRP